MQTNVEKSVVPSLVERLTEDSVQKIVVGAIIVRNGQILLLRRTTNDFMGGLVELPSGTVDADEDILGALVREVKEETGLEIVSVDRYTGSFDYISKSGKKTRQLNFSVGAKGMVQIDPREHDSYYWVAPDDQEFKSLSLSDETRESILKVLR